MQLPIPYGKHQLDDEDIQAVIDVLRSDFLTQGPKIDAFENAFANYVHAKYCVAVSNGTAALHLACLSKNIQNGDLIITTPMTFAATANCVLYCGGKVQFIDINSETYLIDLNMLEDTLKSKPKGYFKGVISVDYGGLPTDLESLYRLGEEYGFWIISDCSHSPGGYFMDSQGNSQYCGNCNYAELSTFSFHPVKHIASGEGGMITTKSKEVYQKLKTLRTHGIVKDPATMLENHGGWYYEMHDLGYNYRMTDIQAALGLSQLKKADINLERRKKIAQKYDDAFRNTEVTVQKIPGKFEHAYHLYIIQHPKRDVLYDYLKENQIFVQVHYIPIHIQPYYRKIGWKTGDFPNTEKLYHTCLSLPMYPSLTNEQQEYVIEKILSFR